MPRALQLLLRACLMLYPKSFRDRFGRSLTQVVADVYRHEVESGHRVKALTFYLVQWGDLAIGGVVERSKAIIQRITANRPTHGIPQPREASAMSRVLQDLRFAVRTSIKQPIFTLVVVGTVGLGVGANTTMFSIVNGVLLQELPYENPDELVRVFQSDRFNGTLREGVSGPDYFDYVQQQTVFEQMAAWTGFNPTLSEGLSDPERVNVAQATHTLFPTLGWQAELGRTFSPDEDVPDGRAVTILSYGLWKRRFGSDLDVVGRSIQLDGRDYAVVGVMPADFLFLPNTDVWLPLQYGPTTGLRGNHGLNVIARLKDGATIAAARDEMSRIMARLEQEYPEDNIGRGATVDRLDSVVTGGVRPALLLLMGSVAFVLLIACANVANMLFSRGAARQRELAVRLALGAGPARVMSQLMTESLVLAAAGGAFGLGIALAGVRLLHSLNPTGLPRLSEITLDPGVIGFAMAATGLTGLVFGVLPAWRASRTPLSEVLSEGARSSSGARTGKLRSALTVAQVSVAFALVVGAGLLIKSMWNLLRVEPGFQHGSLVTVTVTLPQTRYPNSFRDWPDVPEVHRFHSEVLQRAQRLPMVTGATLAANGPTDPGWTSRVMVEGGPQTVEEGVEEERNRQIGPGYFATIGTPIIHGREFNQFDRGDTPPVVVVNDAFAKKYFPGENPLGKHISFWGVMRQIVGVAGDVRFMGLDRPSRPAYYSPLSQLPMSNFEILLRIVGDPEPAIAAMRDQIRQIDSQLAVYNAFSFDAIMSRSLAPQRFNLVMLGLFAALALALAAVGIYGVISYGVSQRVHEFGVRLSLGAEQAKLSQLVLRQALALAIAGIGLGLAVALAGSRLISGLLFNVTPMDPITLSATALFLGLVAVLAALIPAHRASKVSPMVTLRQQG
jgi:putative ABC transport system permease protein